MAMWMADPIYGIDFRSDPKGHCEGEARGNPRKPRLTLNQVHAIPGATDGLR